jgi:hypothetical protein
MFHWIKNFVMDRNVPGAAVGYTLGLLLPTRRREQLSAVAFAAAVAAKHGPDIVWDDLQRLGKVVPPPAGLLERKFLEAELASEFWIAKMTANNATRMFNAHWLMDWDYAQL